MGLWSKFTALLDFKANTVVEKIFINLGIIFIFACINYIIEYLGEVKNIKFFKGQFQFPDDHKIHFGNTLYFTLITHFTVGYGDYYPKRHIAKWITAFHVFFAWYINIIALMTHKEKKEVVTEWNKSSQRHLLTSIGKTIKGKKGSLGIGNRYKVPTMASKNTQIPKTGVKPPELVG